MRNAIVNNETSNIEYYCSILSFPYCTVKYVTIKEHLMLFCILLYLLQNTIRLEIPQEFGNLGPHISKVGMNFLCSGGNKATLSLVFDFLLQKNIHGKHPCMFISF